MMSASLMTDLTDLVASPDVLTEHDLQSYHDEGWLMLRGLISRQEAETLRQEVMAIMDIIGLETTKLKQTNEYLRESHLDRFVNSPHLRSLAGRLMDGEAELYLPFTAVKSGSGGGEFHFHQDNQYTRFDGPGINLWFALTPMTLENGCLKVVPKSHLQGTLPSMETPDKDGHKTVTFEPEDFVPAIMEPGDCCIFSRLTVHGSGPNFSPSHRVGYAVQYNRTDGNYSTDSGHNWVSFKSKKLRNLAPVDRITPPRGKIDGH